MQRRIYLVRHAQANPGTPEVSDELRALTPAGKIVSTQVGKFLYQKNSNLNLIISSHAKRAHHTALHISKELNLQTEVCIEKILYSENLTGILQLLNLLPDVYSEVMLVGHYPTIVELQNYLASNNQLTSMNTGELVVLGFENNWAGLSAGTALHEYSYHPSYTQA
ncbi:MAG TPA: histidine phosphatase family protein [Cyclobacteriaceae bacterium]|jgi:phosphohistidine phosphatase|nr:histidine phosphatase family protein [Cytophagales bacterium]HMR58221.1 histidine phosphatase family protein [Cyclobacteriaceae bacterium]HNT50187.1 histidine phosphatase family protein [Cyclobacteriaceae bacterium]HRE66957.1 histidine phosphatase family protein [Cyclobacteriaceae bacterium]HRF33131.1 histidine phosphatase family protein [Cyclobacteriaceae bacterium]